MRKWFRLAVLTTCVLAASIFGVLVVRDNLVAGEPPDLSRYLLTKPRVLFSLPYGEGPSQVGMDIPKPEEEGEASGPSDFAVSADGSIYIGDQRNGKVKKFSRSGKLLMMTAGRIDRIAGMAVDNQGKIYVIHGALSNEVAVYDEKGKRLPDAERKIMGAAKNLAEELSSTQPQLAKDIFDGRGGVPAGAVRCDGAGNVYFRRRQFHLKFDSQFTRAQVLKGHPLDGGGSFYSYRLLPSQQQVERLVYGIDGSLVNRFLTDILERAEVTIYGADGSAIRKFVLPQGEWSEVERLVSVGGGSIDCDGRGHFYTRRSPVAVYHLPLKPNSPSFFVVRSYAVLEYDGEGNFVGLRAVINGFTMPSIHWVEVDLQGNVYWLDHKAEHVDVMMAPAP